MIRLVTDSGSMLPGELRDRYSIAVLPITVTVEGRDYDEGIDLIASEFCDRLRDEPTVSTAAPAPGAFAGAYQSAVEVGATAILSIHTGGGYSATVSSAVVAARLVDVPVPELARRGRRFVTVDGVLTPTSVLELAGGALRDLAHVDDLDDAIELMIDSTRRRARERPVRVGVGHADRGELADHVATRLEHEPGVDSVIVYEIGPSVGARTGAGTIGVVYAPVRAEHCRPRGSLGDRSGFPPR